MFADLSFWYHLPYLEICAMPMSAIQLYMERLPKRQAALRVMMGEAASVPHMDEEGRRNWSRDMGELLNGGRQIIETTPPAMLKMIGIGVEFVQ